MPHPLSLWRPRSVEWKLEASSLKRYPHFDPQISVAEAVALATDPTRVAKHTFYPFMLFNTRWTKFAAKGAVGKEKSRPIRYSARADSYIFSYYRHTLSEAYEASLIKAGISDCVLAYRRLRTGAGEGKCNIHFAKDAFERVIAAGDCAVVALDISSFFEHLDHDRLRAKWCGLIKQSSLPPDHERVFHAVTRYAVVEKKSVYERLGYFGEKRRDSKGNPIFGYLISFRDIPSQLCTGKQFREKIAGGNGAKSLIQVNFKSYGIPQGSPISDLLANLYLFDFDLAMRDVVAAVNGSYFRYSDDILLIVPGGPSEGLSLMRRAQDLIKSHGRKLRIKEEKCSVFAFKAQGVGQTFRLIHGSQGKNGLEYLGFRFDGKRVYIRDSTLSNLQRKIARKSKSAAIRLVKRYPGKSLSFLEKHSDVEGLIMKFGRVRDFDERSDEYRSWTFWTYACTERVIS